MSEADVADNSEELVRLAQAFDDLRGRICADDGQDALTGLAHAALERVPGTRFASISVRHGAQFRTAAATDERACAADEVQYQLGSGPCVDAAENDAVYQPQDLRHDPRWPEFGRRVVDEVGMRSMLAFRLSVDGGDLTGALNLYSDEPGAFDTRSRSVGLLLATHASALVDLTNQTEKSANLERALETAREIGIGIGVLMAQHKITREAAFDLLRIASQNSHRKLRDLAAEVADTGTLPT